MCGICGIMSTSFIQKELATFDGLMVTSILRGWVGSGVIAVSTKGAIDVIKNKETGVHLVMSDKFNKILKTPRSILIGHTRAPTRGTAGYNDIHPHRAEHILGVHNGTLTKVAGKELEPKQSDSSELFKDIAKRGVQKAIADCRGAYALVWLDEKEKSLNFLRNGQRPLALAYSHKEHPSTIYWASEKETLEYVLSQYGVENPFIYSLRPDTLLKFPMDVKLPFRPEIVENIKQKEDVSAGFLSRPRREASAVPGLAKEFDWGPKRDEPITPNFPQSHTSRDGGKKFETKKHHFVGEDYLEKILQTGCVWCGAVVDRKEYENGGAHFINIDEYACTVCAPELRNVASI